MNAIYGDRMRNYKGRHTQSDFVFVKNTLGLAPGALRLGHKSSCEKKVFLIGQTVYPPPPLSTVNLLRPLTLQIQYIL